MKERDRREREKKEQRTMAAARTLAFESFPEWKLHLKYFSDVTNAVELAELITSGKLPENTAVINAKLVPGE